MDAIQEDYVQRARCWLLPPVPAERPLEGQRQMQCWALLAQLERYGYTLDRTLLHALAALDDAEFATQTRSLLRVLSALQGAHVEHEAMYPNFPEQVQAMSEDELYRYAFVHYLGDALGIRVMPAPQTKRPRAELNDEIELVVLKVGSWDDYRARMQALLTRTSALSGQDRAALLAWFAHDTQAIKYLPDQLPNRETKALLLGQALWAISPHAVLSWAQRWGYTATDILRIACALVDGDVSLAQPCRFRLNRPARRLLLQLLEEIASLPRTAEDMLRHHERWKRLSECLHPHEHKRFVGAQAVFQALRAGQLQSFQGRFLMLLAQQDFHGAVKHLSTRAGEFARRLDYLLRSAPDADAQAWVAKRFVAVAEQVQTTVLLQLWHHFQHRATPQDRLFYPKGLVAKLWVRAENRALLPEALCAQWEALLRELLQQRFAQRPALGKVYVDPELQHYPVPWRARSASKALYTLASGSSLPLEASHTLRFFVYWQQGNERVDVDLSAVFFDRDFNYLNTIAYYHLKHEYAVHSGDITSAPYGASEFIDVQWNKAKQEGVRYVLLSVNSFSGQPYKDLPQCFAGVMTRQSPMSGEIFEAKTVRQRWDLSADTQITLPLVVDLQEKRLIWLDLSLTRDVKVYNNVMAHLSSMALLVKSALEQKKLSLWQLFTLRACARGTLVSSPEEADWVFAPEGSENNKHQQWVTSEMMDEIVQNFL